jgi:hypothetical protein
MLLAIAILLLVGVASLRADEPAKDKATVNKGEKPKETPGWIVVEDDFWYPMRFEFVDWAHDARVHYRQQEEKAAADQIMKAEWWLRFAAKHALPITKKSLVAAADDLHLMHEDIGEGKLITANRLDQSIARADQALAEWHYFNAKENLGHEDEKLAALNLQAAGRYLQDAAQSARYEYGTDTVTLLEDVDKDGNLVDEGVTVDRNRLSDNLTALESAVNRMGAVLKKAAGNK